MTDTFQLPVDFNGQESEYPAQIMRFGYTSKVLVTVNGTEVTFEPDEEGSYRALVQLDVTTQIPKGLLEEISATLQVLFE